MVNETKISIKNMVCPRCIKVVREELEGLGLTIKSIELGSVIIRQFVDTDLKVKISQVLENNGFELLENKNVKLIEKVKLEIISLIQNFEEIDLNTIVLTEYLKQKIDTDYQTISGLFSKTLGITIEHFYILQKIEKVKELLRYNEYTLSEIAYNLGYSSVQHLSNQFKKYTGMTASRFKNESKIRRNPIDSI